MITHCKKCDINWARLWQQDGTEAVEVCPQCGTDMFLEEGTDIVSYIKCPISGRITEVGGMREKEYMAIPKMKRTRLLVWEESWEEFKLRQEDAQDKIISRYMALCDKMPSPDAYRQACSESEKVERKFHFEEVTI